MKVTVVLAPGPSVTGCATWMGFPPPGGVIVAVAVPAWGASESLVTSACTVSADVDPSGASSWET